MRGRPHTAAVEVNHKVTVEDLKEEIFTVLEPWPKLIEAMEEQPLISGRSLWKDSMPVTGVFACIGTQPMTFGSITVKLGSAFLEGGAQELARRGVDKLGGVPLDGELDCKDEDEEPEAQQMETQDVNAVLKRLEMISKEKRERFIQKFNIRFEGDTESESDSDSDGGS
eukprot:FR737389.1.p1 GENE.FR737389.1~~FR737389.1.p1  ORF type:complete len:183 (+),score=26.86 FR737389.1:44-550(+)